MPKEEALMFLKKHEEVGYVLVESDGNIVFGNLHELVQIEWQK
jgi:thiamine biosynthesis lipoprotein